jgi:hypothetical protein
LFFRAQLHPFRLKMLQYLTNDVYFHRMYCGYRKFEMIFGGSDRIWQT